MLKTLVPGTYPHNIKPFSLLIKPASADCNLNCSYCFYRWKSALYPETKVHRMEDGLLEHIIKSYLEIPLPSYEFSWQGGEPALMGAVFFKKVTALQQKHARPGSLIFNGLQTNATLISEELADHCARYRFLAGVSIDGPEEVHDLYRKDAGGTGSYRKVLKGIRTLQKHGAAFNAMVLVHNGNADRAEEVYRYLKELGILHHQYIPCVEFGNDGELLPWAVDGRSWGMFLSGLFHAWHPSDIYRVEIRNFDALLRRLVYGRPAVCSMAEQCDKYFVVEHNGDVYPCDFFVERDLKLGNITADSWRELQESDLYRSFALKKGDLGEKCGLCRYSEFCSGDCRKYRYGSGPAAGTSVLCEGWIEFYDRFLPVFRELADSIREGKK